MPPEDYMHYGWHKIYEWNAMVFQDGKNKAEKQFDDLLEDRAKKRKRNMPTVPTGDPTIWQQ
jgi:hypothetical protein